MRNERDEAEALLEARIGDALEKSRRGEVAVLSYLTPREQKLAERSLRAGGEWQTVYFWGGYPTAERVCLFCLPDYLVDMLEAMAEPSHRDIADLLGDSLGNAVCAVRVRE